MANSSSDSVHRQVQRLFSVGTVGPLSDGQLLDRFISERDDAREAAFEELMIRHGPMVLRVCRSVLQDAHDAEDAFQAVFLVLAHRASSIRRRDSIASWLFGVAHRVASRARKRAVRRRARDQRVAERTSEEFQPADECHDWAVLHEEIDRLPERLRAPLTLCYLEGFTYEAAARRLALSEGVVRGRLSRARERLRVRLSRRGATVPAGLLVAGAAGQAQAAIPLILIHSTLRIALGFMVGNRAAVLARGVLNSMLINKVKVVAILLLLGIGGGYSAWCAIGAASDDKGQAPAKQTDTGTYRLIGSMRVDETDEPVAMAKLQIHQGDFFDAAAPKPKLVETGPDGQFAVDVPAGPIRIGILELPPGYIGVLSNSQRRESLFVGREEPVIHVEYHARRGTKWHFQLTRGADRRPAAGFVQMAQRVNSGERCQAETDDRGQLHLTLPTEARTTQIFIRESAPFSSQLDTGFLSLGLEWESDFRSDAIREISPLEGKVRRFRLIDVNEKSAILRADVPIEPVSDNGEVVIHVAMPYADFKDFGAVTGQVLDRDGRPIAGAFAGLGTTGYRVSDQLRHQSTTNAQGWYRLRDIPRRRIDGVPLEPRIVVAKEGYAGYVSEPLRLKEDTTEKFQLVNPIRLKQSELLRGVVVDHRGQPVVGALVRSSRPIRYSGLSQGIPADRTDEQGRFVLRNLQRGATELSATDGRVWERVYFLRVGSSQPICLQLPERPPPGFIAKLPLAGRDPVRVNQAAPDWQVGKWSDGIVRTLADDLGKVVVLYFWGTDFWQSVDALPALARLAAAFEPRGVDFRAIHHPNGDERLLEEHARKMFAENKIPFEFALDQPAVAQISRGMTALRYGVKQYPVVIIIDRRGNIAFRSDTTAGDRNMAAVFMKILTEPEMMTKDKANQMVERVIAEEIELVLKQND